jgi:hypothetical protein
VPDGGGENVFIGSAGLERAGLLDEPAAGGRFNFTIGFDKRDRRRAEDIARVGDDAETVARIWPPREPVRP